MFVLRWVLLVVALAVALAIVDGTVWRWWTMPPRVVIVEPIKKDSELWRLMQDASAASRAEEHQRAAELYTRALAIEPGPNVISQDLHVLRGSEYNYLNLSDKAFADYDAAVRIGYPGRPMSSAGVRAHMGRGYALVGLAQYARAKADFDVVLKEVPRSSNALAWRGAAHQGLGDREQAIADYQAALVLDPDNTTARDGLKDLEQP